MTEKELERLRIIQDLISGRTTPRAAAQILSVTERTVWRLRERLIKCGPPGIASLHRGKPSNRMIPDYVRQHTMNIVKTYYGDFGPTFACQKLREQHRLHVSVETLRAWMSSEGLWIERKKRATRIHQPRERRECLGELIQIDGSKHYWFEDRGPQCVLLVYIDDATSRLMQMKFVESESAFAYFTATSDYLLTHGKPVAFYSDKHSIFRVADKHAVGGNGMTQFGRALHELNIDIICANTPQAKGRVERANRTLQDRLVKELRLAGISSMEDGNLLLPAFMDDYNSRFAKPPRNDKNLHRGLAPSETLEDILVWREERTVSKCLTIQYDKVVFLLEQTDLSRTLAGKRVDVSEYPNGRVMVTYEGHPLTYSIFDKVRQVNQGAIVDNKRLSVALELIQEQQALRPQYRSEKSPRRRSQEGTIFSPGAPLVEKRRVRRRLAVSNPPVDIQRSLTRPVKQELSYEEELYIEMGRKMFEQRSKAGEELRMRRRLSRSPDRKLHLSSGLLAEQMPRKKALKLVDQ